MCSIATSSQLQNIKKQLIGFLIISKKKHIYICESILFQKSIQLVVYIYIYGNYCSIGFNNLINLIE